MLWRMLCSFSTNENIEPRAADVVGKKLTCSIGSADKLQMSMLAITHLNIPCLEVGSEHVLQASQRQLHRIIVRQAGIGISLVPLFQIVVRLLLFLPCLQVVGGV